MQLTKLAPDLWIAEQPLRFLGLQLGARMTVVRLQDGKLLLHSPIAWSAELAAQLDNLGTPAFIIAPNRLHHLFVGAWLKAFPGCQLHVAPGVEIKRPDLVPTSVLGRSQNLDFSDELHHLVLNGCPFTNEVVFFHPRTATMIASDMVFNIGPHHAAMTRLFFRLNNAYGRPAVSLLERFMIKDRDAFHRDLNNVLAWPIDRLIMAHGDIVDGDGHAALTHAYQFVLRKALPAGIGT